MTIENYTFSPDEIKELKEHRDNQKNPRLKNRFIALLLLSEGVSISTIITAIGVTKRTIEKWFKIYITNGIDCLNSVHYKPKKSYLKNKEIKELIEWVKENRPPSVKIICDFIKERFGITYCLDAVRKILKKNGLKFMRAKLVPGKPPTKEEQLEFVREYEEVRQFAGAGVVILFCDAMHLVHQTVPCFCWGDPKDPPTFKTNSGRQRLNILGAYNPVTHNLIHNTSEANCDSQQVIVFFEMILKVYPKSHSIVLFLDNAPYFHSAEVSEWLENHPKMICRFLPTYAPNLNLIERLWHFVKEKLVNNTYYEKYKTFRAHAFRLLNNISNYKDQLVTLMVEKFEIIDPSTQKQ